MTDPNPTSLKIRPEALNPNPTRGYRRLFGSGQVKYDLLHLKDNNGQLEDLDI